MKQKNSALIVLLGLLAVMLTVGGVWFGRITAPERIVYVNRTIEVEVPVEVEVIKEVTVNVPVNTSIRLTIPVVYELDAEYLLDLYREMWILYYDHTRTPVYYEIEYLQVDGSSTIQVYEID